MSRIKTRLNTHRCISNCWKNALQPLHKLISFNWRNVYRNIYAPVKFQDDDDLQIMTIHQAKGLEFDTVILPYLERQPMHDENNLLLWMERPAQHATSDLILAPVKSITVKEDAIYNYLRRQEAKKSHYETARLLYVAATRAKNNLHLLGNVNHNAKAEAPAPASGSLLQLLWPVIAEDFMEGMKSSTPMQKLDAQTIVLPQFINRLRSSWQMSKSFAEDKYSLLTNLNVVPVKSVLPDLIPRAVGTIVHQWLQKISHEGPRNWHGNKIKQQRIHWKKSSH